MTKLLRKKVNYFYFSNRKYFTQCSFDNVRSLAMFTVIAIVLVMFLSNWFVTESQRWLVEEKLVRRKCRVSKWCQEQAQSIDWSRKGQHKSAWQRSTLLVHPQAKLAICLLVFIGFFFTFKFSSLSIFFFN